MEQSPATRRLLASLAVIVGNPTAELLQRMLTRMTEKVERAYEIQKSAGPVEPEDWEELNMLCGEARMLQKGGDSNAE